MQVRPAVPADHPALAEIFLQVRRESFTWNDPGSFRLEDFAVETEGEAIYLAQDAAGNIAGFISVWEPENFVHHLFVAEACRGWCGNELTEGPGAQAGRSLPIEVCGNECARLGLLPKTGMERDRSRRRKRGLLSSDGVRTPRTYRMISARHPHDRPDDRGDDPRATGQDAEGARHAAPLHG